MSHSGGLCSYGLLLLGDLEGPGSLEGENMAKMFMHRLGRWSLMISMKDPPLKESHWVSERVDIVSSLAFVVRCRNSTVVIYLRRCINKSLRYPRQAYIEGAQHTIVALVHFSNSYQTRRHSACARILQLGPTPFWCLHSLAHSSGLDLHTIQFLSSSIAHSHCQSQQPQIQTLPRTAVSFRWYHYWFWLLNDWIWFLRPIMLSLILRMVIAFLQYSPANTAAAAGTLRGRVQSPERCW